MRLLVISAALLSTTLLTPPARSAPGPAELPDGSDATAESKTASEPADTTPTAETPAEVRSTDPPTPQKETEDLDESAKQTAPDGKAPQDQPEKEVIPQTTSADPQDPCPEKEADAPYTGPRPLLPSNKEKMSYGGYGGLTVLATGIQGQAAMLIGGEGAFLMNHRFVLGVGGYGLTSMVDVDRYANGDGSLLLMGYGGPIIRYQFFGNGPLVLSVGALFGGGGVGFLRETFEENWEIEEDYSTGQVFFVMEPSIQGHVQLTRWMRLGVNLNYRAVQGVATRGVDDRGLSGFAGGGHMQFGWF